MDTYQKYTRRADRAANRLAPHPDRVDQYARDRDDYYQLFVVRALESAKVYQDQPGQPNDQDRWVGAALHNQMVSYFRGLTQARVNQVQVEVDEDILAHPGAVNPERQVVARDLLRRVAEKMEPGEWEVLVLCLENGVKHTWKERASGCSYDTFRRRVFRARERAQRNIKKLVPDWRGEAS